MIHGDWRCHHRNKTAAAVVAEHLIVREVSGRGGVVTRAVQRPRLGPCWTALQKLHNFSSPTQILAEFNQAGILRPRKLLTIDGNLILVPFLAESASLAETNAASLKN